jgi:hypothetical protein
VLLPFVNIAPDKANGSTKMKYLLPPSSIIFHTKKERKPDCSRSKKRLAAEDRFASHPR